MKVGGTFRSQLTLITNHLRKTPMSVGQYITYAYTINSIGHITGTMQKHLIYRSVLLGRAHAYYYFYFHIFRQPHSSFRQPFTLHIMTQTDEEGFLNKEKSSYCSSRYTQSTRWVQQTPAMANGTGQHATTSP